MKNHFWQLALSFSGITLWVAFTIIALNAPTAQALQQQSNPPSSNSYQLVQSVPAGTQLANPKLPYAKETWVRSIQESQSTIDIEQMYVQGEDGEALDDVITALKQAAEVRNVKIRFLVSSKMKDTDPATMARIKAIKNLEMRDVDYGALTGGIQHAKFFIFDHKKIFVGSQNFDWKALTQILELGVQIEDATIASQLQSIFDLDWSMALTKKIPEDLGVAASADSQSDVLMVASPAATTAKNIPDAFSELKGMILSANKILKISVMDYSTFRYGSKQEWTELDQLLRIRAAEGLRIQLLVSHWNTEEPEIRSIKSLCQVPNVEVRIATIPEIANRPLSFARVNHGKFMIADSATLWMGTSNWSHGYFFATRGIEFIFKKPEMAADAEVVFDLLWKAPYTEPVDVNRDYPKPRK
jgi:phosphatidylserine/phosphatidylglycerophosphate/cardiolipin synthase-like enzyme